jgi:hypothetical protein
VSFSVALATDFDTETSWGTRSWGAGVEGGVGRQVVRVGLVVALGVLVWAAGSAPAGASCVGPSLTVSPEPVAPGAVLQIRGQAFGTDCNDTGGPGPALGEPAADIELAVVQGDTVIHVARVDAQPDYAFKVRVTAPPSLQPGPAAVRVTSGLQPGPSTTFDVITATAPVSPTTVTPTSVQGVGIDTVDTGDGQFPWVVSGLVLTAAGVGLAAWAFSRRASGRRRW